MRIIVITVIVVLSMVVGIQAQERRPLEFSLAGGVSLPASPDGFANGWKAGPGGMFGVGYRAVSHIHVMAAVEYHVFPHDPALPKVADSDKGRRRIFLFGLDDIADERIGRGPIRLLAMGGIGVAHVTVSRIEDMGWVVIEGEAETGLSLAIGGGFQWELGRNTALFVCGRYIGILTEGETTSLFPVMIGCRF